MHSTCKQSLKKSAAVRSYFTLWKKRCFSLAVIKKYIKQEIRHRIKFIANLWNELLRVKRNAYGKNVLYLREKNEAFNLFEGSISRYGLLLHSIIYKSKTKNTGGKKHYILLKINTAHGTDLKESFIFLIWKLVHTKVISYTNVNYLPHHFFILWYIPSVAFDTPGLIKNVGFRTVLHSLLS